MRFDFKQVESNRQLSGGMKHDFRIIVSRKLLDKIESSLPKDRENAHCIQGCIQFYEFSSHRIRSLKYATQIFIARLEECFP